MKRIGIYGGTFNPPHMGHLEAAKYAVDALDLDLLLLIPGGTAPHKRLPQGSPTPEQRLEMLRLAVAGLDRVQVSDLELIRDGTSYTADTVAQLRQIYPEAELVLLMGTDMLERFLQWKDAREILEHVSLAGFGRGLRGEGERMDAAIRDLEAAGARVIRLHNPVIDISSTQLRRMLVFGCAGAFLPAAVEEYIRHHGLYETDRDLKHLPMEDLEDIVVRLLDPKRVAHVLGCRDTAADLARHWGVDVTDAARAGALHDITKALDGPLQLTLCSAYGTMLDDFSRRYPKTLHALTGSLVAERIFGENEAVVAAICSHTTGKAEMNDLEKIIYIADYMEPCRDFPGVERLRELAYTDLDAALRCGLEMTLAHLARQGNEVSPESRDALAWLEEHGK